MPGLSTPPAAAGHQGPRVPGPLPRGAGWRYTGIAAVFTRAFRRQLRLSGDQQVWGGKEAGMPVTYEVDKTLGLVWTRLVGVVTVDELVAHFQELEQNPDAPVSLNVLLDLTDLTTVPDAGQLRTLTKEMTRVYQRIHFNACAIVASRDVLFGMARMWEVFAGECFQATRTFRHLEEARTWLASDPTPED